MSRRADEHEPAECPRCGSSTEWVNCWNCGGEGYSHHNCGEDSCCCLDPEDNVRCRECGGRGGAWHCLSSPEWCEANPLPGRAAVPSTAMSSDAWRDAQ